MTEYVAANRASSLPAAQGISTNPNPSSSVSALSVPSAPGQIVNCDEAGCWDTNGIRYNKGAGETYFPSTGGVCQNVGGQMNCS